MFTANQVLLQEANARRKWVPPCVGATPTKCAQDSVLPCRLARPPGNPDLTHEYLHSRDFARADGRIAIPKEAELSDSQQRIRSHTERAIPHPEDIASGRVPLHFATPLGTPQLGPMDIQDHMRGGRAQENLRHMVEDSLLGNQDMVHARVKQGRTQWSSRLEVRKLLGHAVGGTRFLRAKHATKRLQGHAPLRPALAGVRTIFDTTSTAHTRCGSA